MLPRPPTSTLFPYTTLFRSAEVEAPLVLGDLVQDAVGQDQPALVIQTVFRGAEEGGDHAREPERHTLPGRRRRRVTTELPLNTDRKSTRLNSSHSQISYAVF